MEVSKNKVVSIAYKLRLNDKESEVVETVSPESPLTFLFGSGYLLPKFEDRLSGLKPGETFDFNLDSTEAYGNFDPDSVLNIPMQAFEVNGKVDHELVKVGNTIPMQDSEGNKLNGVVREIETETVTMDFNHPLAGNSLYFSGEITDIRQATEEELSHGHVHGDHSCDDCDHCGNGDGCC